MTAEREAGAGSNACPGVVASITSTGDVGMTVVAGSESNGAGVVVRCRGQRVVAGASAGAVAAAVEAVRVLVAAQRGRHR